MPHKRVGSMIQASKKQVVEVKGEARQWTMRLRVTIYLFKATVWHGCDKHWNPEVYEKCVPPIRVLHSEVSPFVHTLTSLNCRAIHEGHSIPFQVFWPWPHFCNFTSLAFVSHWPCMEPLSQTTSNIATRQMLRLAGFLLATVGPPTVTVITASPWSVQLDLSQFSFKVLLWHWLPDKPQREHFSVLLMFLLLSFAQCVG
jgi:hypothetical protein